MKSIIAKSDPYRHAPWWTRNCAAASAKGILPNDRARQHRLFEALRLDNQGAWFRCRSHWTAAQIERRFTEGLMASALYQRVGGILQADSTHLYVQIALVTATLHQHSPDADPEWRETPVSWPEAAVEIALDEMRVELLHRVPNIEAVLRSGHY